MDIEIRNSRYGLDIWQGGKVLNLEWDDDDGPVRIVTFKRGPWEDVLLQEAAILSS